MPEGNLILLADLSIVFLLRPFGIPGNEAHILPELLNMTAVSLSRAVYSPGPLILDFAQKPWQLLNFA